MSRTTRQAFITRDAWDGFDLACKCAKVPTRKALDMLLAQFSKLPHFAARQLLGLEGGYEPPSDETFSRHGRFRFDVHPFYADRFRDKAEEANVLVTDVLRGFVREVGELTSHAFVGYSDHGRLYTRYPQNIKQAA